MSRVLVTGASGFIGAALTARLRQLSVDLVTADRTARAQPTHVIGALSATTDWRAALEGVTTVVHLASPAHARVPEAEARAAIVEASAVLAAQAEAAGVARFIYMSSIKACVDATEAAVDEATPPHPTDAYGRAKLAAEQAVLARQRLNPIVVRPPLIHAAHAKANWARLLRVLDSDTPLPLAGLHNTRTLMALDSLVDALVSAITAPSAPSGVFHLGDRPAVSTTALAALLRQGMGRAPRLFSAPWLAPFLPAQLRDSLEVDSTAFRSAFGHAGPDTREALIACGRAWAAAR